MPLICRDMSELQYGVIPELEKKLVQAREQERPTVEQKILRNRVTEEEVADIVSKWTRIPWLKWLKAKSKNYCEWRMYCIIEWLAKIMQLLL